MVEEKHGGRIINISSAHEDLPFPGFTPYACAKGGMRMLTRNAAIELAQYGIIGLRVNRLAGTRRTAPLSFGMAGTALSRNHAAHFKDASDELVDVVEIAIRGLPQGSWIDHAIDDHAPIFID